jgi:Cu+-exporting ATPase
MYKKHKLSQFTITYQSDQKIKIIVPSLFNDEERAVVLKTILLMRDAIEEVRAEVKTNAVTINYNDKVLPKQNLINLLQSVLKNFSQKPKMNLAERKGKSYQFAKTAHTALFKVEGMSCHSCALFLEMVLTRHPHVSQVSINYESKTGSVKSFLEADEIIYVIAENGYEASLAEHPVSDTLHSELKQEIKTGA